MPVHRCDGTSDGVMSRHPKVEGEVESFGESRWHESANPHRKRLRAPAPRGPARTSGPRQQNQGGHDPGHRCLAVVVRTEQGEYRSLVGGQAGVFEHDRLAAALALADPDDGPLPSTAHRTAAGCTSSNRATSKPCSQRIRSPMALTFHDRPKRRARPSSHNRALGRWTFTARTVPRRWRWAALGDQAQLARSGDGFRSVNGAKLGQDMADMLLDSVEGNHELRGDGLIRHACRKHRQYL